MLHIYNENNYKEGVDFVNPYHPYRTWHHYFPPQPYYFYPPAPRYPFPPVNPTQFMSSAKHMQIIMKDASILLSRMSHSREFSYALMEAAQESNQEKVNQLVKETGIQTTPKVSYTPDGLKLDFDIFVENLNCCHLSLSLKWRV